MAEQLKLYRNIKIEKSDEPKKLRWDKRETFWIGRVKSTKKEHTCARCVKAIPPNSRANVTVDLEIGKPDFKTVKYWHPDEKCPDPVLSKKEE